MGPVCLPQSLLVIYSSHNQPTTHNRTSTSIVKSGWATLWKLRLRHKCCGQRMFKQWMASLLPLSDMSVLLVFQIVEQSTDGDVFSCSSSSGNHNDSLTPSHNHKLLRKSVIKPSSLFAVVVTDQNDRLRERQLCKLDHRLAMPATSPLPPVVSWAREHSRCCTALLNTTISFIVFYLFM